MDSETRASESEIRGIVESRMFTDAEIRRRCLTALADSIVYADRLGHGVWSVTLQPRPLIRLNVGRTQVLVLAETRSDTVDIVLDGEMLSPEARASLALQGEWWWEDRRPYQSLPTAVHARLPAETFVQLLPQL